MVQSNMLLAFANRTISEDFFSFSPISLDDLDFFSYGPGFLDEPAKRFKMNGPVSKFKNEQACQQVQNEPPASRSATCRCIL